MAQIDATNVRSKPHCGFPISSWGSTFFVMCTDGGTAAADPNDPWQHDSEEMSAAIRTCSVPYDFSFLDVHYAWANTDPAAGPTVNFYGKVPFKEKFQGRSWPTDVDATNFPDPGTASLWVPLGDETPDYGIVLPIVTPADHDTDGYKIGPPTRIFLAGCTDVIALISAADDGAPDASMVLGRFVT